MLRHLATLACVIALLWEPAASVAADRRALRTPETSQALPKVHHNIEAIGNRLPMHGLQGLAFGSDGALYAGGLTGRTIYRVDIASGAVTTFLGPPRGGAGDLAFAPDGTVVWTNFAQGAVYTRGRDGKVRTLVQNMLGASAIGFTNGGRLFLSRDVPGDELYELDPAGVKAPRLVAEKLGALGQFQIDRDNVLYGPLVSVGKIVKIDIETGEVKDVASGFERPAAVAREADGHLIVIESMNGEVVRVDPATGTASHLASVAPPLSDLVIGKDGTIYVTSTAFNGITAIDPRSGAQHRVTWSQLSSPGLIAVTEVDGKDRLLVADAWAPRVVDPDTGEATLIKSERLLQGGAAIIMNGSTYVLTANGFDGVGAVHVVERSTGRPLATFPNFGAVYDVKPLPDGFVVADFTVGRLTKVGNDPAHTRTTFAWNFDGPVGLADAGGGQFYVSEYTGGRISRVDTKTNAQEIVVDGLHSPEGIALAPDGMLIVAEVGEKRVLSVDPATGHSTVLADDLAIGLEGGPQAPAPFLPTGVAVGKGGMIYVTSDIDNIIYRLIPQSSK